MFTSGSAIRRRLTSSRSRALPRLTAFVGIVIVVTHQHLKGPAHFLQPAFPHSANISVSTAKMAYCVSALICPSRLTRRALSIVRTSVLRPFPSICVQLHQTRRFGVQQPVVATLRHQLELLSQPSRGRWTGRMTGWLSCTAQLNIAVLISSSDFATVVKISRTLDKSMNS